jgi:hypothetical protein
MIRPIHPQDRIGKDALTPVRCVKCNRKLLHPVPTQAGLMGSTCARISFGTKPKRIAREDRKSADERQLVFEWFLYIGTTYGVRG